MVYTLKETGMREAYTGEKAEKLACHADVA